ncbi:MAG: DNA methylase, partial [Candidatus Schekmanbacteria bacterium]
DLMSESFKESYRVLKDNGIMVIIFAHKSTAAWETLINSLLNANLVVTASWPISTESATRIRAQKSAALASSITIVCRKRKSEEEGYFSEVKEELKKKIKAKLDQFWSQGIRGADFFISAIGPAVEVFGKYKRVMKLSGEEVSVAGLLDLVREIVTDYSLEKILHGRHMGKVDEQTRFYLLWRWAYDDNDVPYDDARKLAQALGTEADELLNKKDMLEKKGDKVNLMEPWQRKKNAHLGEPKGGIPAPMIDVIHKACLLWEKGNKQELSEFIENSGYADDDTIWNVAQAISEVLPDGNKEKQLIQGLLASKQSISKDVSSKQGKLGEYFR